MVLLRVLTCSILQTLGGLSPFSPLFFLSQDTLFEVPGAVKRQGGYKDDLDNCSAYFTGSMDILL